MKYEQILEEVKIRAQLDNLQQAAEVSRAVLEALGERLFNNEADDLAAQLPEQLAQSLRGHQSRAFGLDEVLAMIAGKTDASPDQAEHYAGTVIAVMKKFISEGELHDVQAQLPKEFSRLFGVGPGEIRKPGLSGER